MRSHQLIRAITVTLALFLTLLAVPATAAPATYTLRGRVVYPDGRPASGIVLRLYPHTGEALDLDNAKWKIPNYNFHQVITGGGGEFVMTNVIDYPENQVHTYVVRAIGPSKFYHGNLQAPLVGDNRDIKLGDLQLKDAAVVRVMLKDRTGRGFTGTRPVYVQTGVLGQGVTKGVSYVVDIEFTNGVGEFGPVVIKDLATFRGRVAVLDLPNAVAVHQALTERGLPFGDTDAPLRWAMKDSRGRAMDRSVRLVPAGYTDLSFER